MLIIVLIAEKFTINNITTEITANAPVWGSFNILNFSCLSLLERSASQTSIYPSKWSMPVNIKGVIKVIADVTIILAFNKLNNLNTPYQINPIINPIKG